MAIYLCESCNQFRDDDYNPCESHEKYDWLCDYCYLELTEDVND